MSFEKTKTLSKVLIVTKRLTEMYKNLKQNKQFSSTGKKVLDDLYEVILNRFKNSESSTTLLVRTFLEPRFKNIYLALNSSCQGARTKITNN